MRIHAKLEAAVLSGQGRACLKIVRLFGVAGISLVYGRFESRYLPLAVLTRYPQVYGPERGISTAHRQLSHSTSIGHLWSQFGPHATTARCPNLYKRQ
jgi:hypothetical protein